MFTDQMYQYPVQPLSAILERKWNSSVEIAPNCPRCASPNTKFCYYNNYSLSQPRYFCKGCRRYWTKGGSLRNVPVGGGCRKNRRARSARPSQNGRVVESSGKNFNSFPSNSDQAAHSGGTSGPEIDLADVFAKFLNDSSSDFQQPEAGSDSLQSHAMIEEHRKPSDHIVEGADLVDEFPQVLDQKNQEDDERIQDLLENDMNVFGLQTWLSDEAVPDELLNGSSVAALPNFSWQPMLQFQDLDCFPAEHQHDQLKTSASLITDNWSSFDLSGFEIYSRP